MLFIAKLATNWTILTMTTYSLNNHFEELVKETLEEEKQTEQNDDTVTVIDESTKSKDFFQNNRCKKERKCTTTRIKSKKFLSNIAHVGINREDVYNESFIFNMHLLTAKNLNLFSLERKIADKNKHEMLYMLWKECISLKFYQHICKEKYFLYLSGKNVLQPKVTEIINKYLNENAENYNEMRNNLSQYRNIF